MGLNLALPLDPLPIQEPADAGYPHQESAGNHAGEECGLLVHEFSVARGRRAREKNPAGANRLTGCLLSAPKNNSEIIDCTYCTCERESIRYRELRGTNTKGKDMKSNEYISTELCNDGWHWTAPSRLRPGTRTKSIHPHESRTAALKAGKLENPRLRIGK